ncbi:hypothetical protein JQ621_35030 [Bradyrhizobium manausense]|uniref:hypothetical protein n=1 Tax=Bradyrhizobium manausense TaxID=989370 RepID=UPI001BAD928E|nr:hypothetical protein [Bradyrhizobium manausense]MBR1092681.1 hypothetical protein [Bradyrhizobium manausense]
MAKRTTVEPNKEYPVGVRATILANRASAIRRLTVFEICVSSKIKTAKPANLQKKMIAFVAAPRAQQLDI